MMASTFTIREDRHGGCRMGGANRVAEASSKCKGKRFHDVRIAALYDMPIHDSNGNRSMTQEAIARRLEEHRTKGLARLRLRRVESCNAGTELREGAVREYPSGAEVEKVLREVSKWVG